MQIVVVDSDGAGALTVWGAVDICSDIEHRTFHLHVVLITLAGGLTLEHSWRLLLLS